MGKPLGVRGSHENDVEPYAYEWLYAVVMVILCITSEYVLYLEPVCTFSFLTYLHTPPPHVVIVVNWNLNYENQDLFITCKYCQPLTKGRNISMWVYSSCGNWECILVTCLYIKRSIFKTNLKLPDILIIYIFCSWQRYQKYFLNNICRCNLFLWVTLPWRCEF